MLSLMGKHCRFLKIVISTIWQERTTFLTEMNYNYKQRNQRPMSQLCLSLGFKKKNYSRQVTCYNCAFLTNIQERKQSFQASRANNQSPFGADSNEGPSPALQSPGRDPHTQPWPWAYSSGPSILTPIEALSQGCFASWLQEGCLQQEGFTYFLAHSQQEKERIKRKECSLPIRDANHSSWYDWVNSTLFPLPNKGRCQGRATGSKVHGSGHPWELETILGLCSEVRNGVPSGPSNVSAAQSPLGLAVRLSMQQV